MIEWKEMSEEPTSDEKILLYIDDIEEVITGYWEKDGSGKIRFYDEGGEVLHPRRWAEINKPDISYR